MEMTLGTILWRAKPPCCRLVSVLLAGNCRPCRAVQLSARRHAGVYDAPQCQPPAGADLLGCLRAVHQLPVGCMAMVCAD